MDLCPSTEQQALVEACRSFIEHRLLPVQDNQGSGPAMRTMWSECAELGWFTLGLEESRGGVGYSLVEEALLHRELGRHLVPGPTLWTTLGARVAAYGGRPDVVAAISDGSVRVGLAAPRASRATDQQSPSGPDAHFVDCDDADYVLFLEGELASLFDRTSVEVNAQVPGLDQTVVLATGRIGSARPLVTVTRAQDPVHTRGIVLLAAALTGIAEATRDLSVAYASLREQFGRPIGAYQAIKHRCANMAVRAEAALAQTSFAAAAIVAGLADDDFQARAARLVAGDAAVQNAADNVQVHGGIGFTFDHSAHRYVERAHVCTYLLGRTTDHLQAVLATPVSPAPLPRASAASPSPG
jgi:hypothetical protein